MHARLIQYDMRELRQALFDILDPATTDDIRGLAVIRRPERRLISNKIPQNSLAEAKGVEHLDRAAGDAVRLPQEHSARFLIDDARLDVVKHGQLGREGQTSRSAAANQDIDLLRNRTDGARVLDIAPIKLRRFPGRPGSKPFR